MIIDKLENAELYAGIHPYFMEAVEFLRNVDSNLPEGKHNINEHLYCYKWDKKSIPIENRDLETHTKVIDFHLVLEGHEYLGYYPIQAGDIPKEYNEELDILPYPDKGKTKILHLEPGTIYLVWPHEGHKSNCHTDTPFEVKKVVVKLPIQI